MRGLLALAFGAGMLSPVNPCGFALLPAYLGYYLGASDRRAAAGLGVRLAQGLRAGVVLTLGFAGTLSVLGLAVTAGARPLLGAAPWLGLVVGAALAVLGAFMLTGRTLPMRLPPPAHPTVTAPTSTPRLAAFGAAYALASLACTVGVLLAVIGQALAAASLAGVLVVFAVYTAGAATLLVLLSVSVALAGGLLIGRIRALLPIASRLAGAVLGLAGVYLVLYWAPVTQARGPGTLLGVGLQPLAARVATWVAAHQTATALLAVAVTLAALTGGQQPPAAARLQPWPWPRPWRLEHRRPTAARHPGRQPARGSISPGRRVGRRPHHEAMMGKPAALSVAGAQHRQPNDQPDHQPATAPPATPERFPGLAWGTRLVLAQLLALAGAIHLLLTPQHAAERPAYGVFFFAAAGRLPAGALAASEHAVVARVRRLLQPPAPPPAWVPGMYLLAAVVLASPAVLLAAPAIAAG